MLLDEPTTGLDPQARHLVWERLFRLKQQGVTLVLTTHYMDEAEQLCDRLVVMDGGRIVAEGSPRALIERHSTREVVELRFAAESQEPFAGKLDGLGERVEVLPDRILLYVPDGDAAVAEVARAGAGRRPTCWCGAAAWRTSSCTSPAAPWSTDRARLIRWQLPRQLHRRVAPLAANVAGRLHSIGRTSADRRVRRQVAVA